MIPAGLASQFGFATLSNVDLPEPGSGHVEGVLNLDIDYGPAPGRLIYRLRYTADLGFYIEIDTISKNGRVDVMPRVKELNHSRSVAR